MCRTRIAVLLLLPLATAATRAQVVPPVEGTRYQDPAKENAQRAVRRQLPSLAQTLPRPVEVRLGDLNGDERKRIEAAALAEAKVAGVHRHVEPSLIEQGRAESLGGERSIWRLALHSEGAAGLRVHFRGFDAGSGRVWVHDGTGEESEIHGPYTGQGLYGDGDFWSSVVFGESLVIEYEPVRPMQPGETPPFRIREVAHLTRGALPRLAEDLKAGYHEAAASCNLDVSCYPDWAETAKAVAHIVFEHGGSSYVCSGTLVNTRSGRGIPYFLTAQHCIADDATARSVNAYWFYQTSTCNGTPPSRRDVPRTLGARYLAGTPTTSGDGTLIQLNAVPSGVTFSGWDPNPLASDIQVVGIHHPSGDYKRVSFATSRSAHPFAGRDLSKFIGAYWNGGGLTEGGSSGSGLFSGSLKLVGMLSHGPKANSAEQYCAMLPFTDNYGSFAAFYPVIRDYLEERTVGGGTPPTTPSPTGGALTPGETRNLKLGPVTGNRLFNGASGFTVTVPQGATRLEVTLRTSTPNADLDLYVRFGQDVTLENGQAVADFRSEGSTGDEQVVISGSQLRAGTYYVALGLFTPGIEVQTALTARVTTATQPPAQTNALISGQARNFTLGPVTSATLYYGENSFTIAVPQGATRLEISLRTSTPASDVDLYARFGQDVALSGTSVVADFKSEGTTGDEQIVITGNDLKAGTYYIAFGLFTTGKQVQCTITATVTTPSQPPTTGGYALVSGQARNFTLGPVTRGTLYNGANGFTIAVPQGATRLEISLRTSTPASDVDLYARFGQDVALSGTSVVADFKSEGSAGDEQIVITGSSLRAGTYYIAFGLFTTGKQVQCTITATVTTPSQPPTTGGNALVSGQARNFTLGPVTGGMLYNGANGFTMAVPQGATRLEISLRTSTPASDVDLYARFGQDVGLSGTSVVADFKSEGSTGDEQIVITGNDLKAGTYYIAFGLFTTGKQVQGTLTATVSSATAPASSALTSGQPRNLTVSPVQWATLLRGASGYTINVPQGATRLEITLRTSAPNVDVDLYARFGQDVALENGAAMADFRSENADANEQIVIAGASLRAGAYYIALGVFTTGTQIQSTLTATVSTAATPPPASAQTLSSGTPASFRIGPVTSPTAFFASRGFQIRVPEGTTRLDVRLAATSPAEADVDLYVRYNRDIEIADGRVVADYVSEGPTGTERITVTPQSSPALQPGTYYVALGLFTPEVEVAGAITATVVVGSAAAPQAQTQLTSGVPAKFSLPGVESPTLFYGTYSFRIAVPDGASKLTVQLRSDLPSVDTDLFARRDADQEVDSSGNVVTDYASTSPYPDETLVIDAASEPPLRPGTYYVSVAVYTQGVPVTGTILATLERTQVQTQGPQAVLRPEVPTRFSLPSVGSPTLFTGADAFRLDVPADATRVDITLNTEPSTTDIDLFVRYGAPPAINSSQGVTADHSSTSETGNEQITIDASSRPYLRSGTYYVALGLYTTDTPATGTVTAVIHRGWKTTAPEDEGVRLRPKPEIRVVTAPAQPLPAKNQLAGKPDASSKAAPLLLKPKPAVRAREE